MPKLEDIPQDQVRDALESLVTPQTDTGLGACRFTREQIKEAWGMGLINDASYIWLAVNFMRTEGQKGFTLDVGEFCDIWAYETDPDTQRIKRLKPPIVKSTIAKWVEKGAVLKPEEPIQMELLF